MLNFDKKKKLRIAEGRRSFCWSTEWAQSFQHYFWYLIGIYAVFKFFRVNVKFFWFREHSVAQNRIRWKMINRQCQVVSAMIWKNVHNFTTKWCIDTQIREVWRKTKIPTFKIYDNICLLQESSPQMEWYFGLRGSLVYGCNINIMLEQQLLNHNGIKCLMYLMWHCVRCVHKFM